MGAGEELRAEHDIANVLLDLTPRPRVDCTKVPDLVETATKRLLLPVHTTEVCLHYYCRLVRLKTRLWGLWFGMFAQLEG